MQLNARCCFTAEFIIDLADKHPTFEEFKAALVKNGADFTVSVHKASFSVVVVDIDVFYATKLSSFLLSGYSHW